MIFKDKIEEKLELIAPEFDKIAQNALKNQKHPGDLLLFSLNGYFEQIEIDNKIKNNERIYCLGANDKIHSDYTHFLFIDNYRKTQSQMIPYFKHLEQFKMEKFDQEICDRNDKILT